MGRPQRQQRHLYGTLDAPLNDYFSSKKVKMDPSYYGFIPIAVILALLCGAFVWRWCTSTESSLPYVAYDPPPPYEP